MVNKEIRLNKVAKELCIGVSTIVDFLSKKGFEIDMNPNAKISAAQYAMLVEEMGMLCSNSSEHSISEQSDSGKKVKRSHILEPSIPRVIGKIDLSLINAKPRPRSDEKREVDTNEEDIIKQKNNSDDIFKPGVVKLSSPRILGSIQLDTNAIESRRKHIRVSNNANATKLIGIVKFFDHFKGFGFVVTNSCNIKDSDKNGNGLIDFYINSNSCSYIEPNDNDWVVFDYKCGRAINVSTLDFNKETLSIALQYRGEFAKIKGKDSRSNETYNHNILAHIVKHYDNNKSTEIVETFCDLLSTFSDEKVDSIILQFLEDKELVNYLFIRIYQSVNYFQDNKYSILFAKFKKSISDAIFEKANIETLNLLPHNFDFSLYNTKICNLLIKIADNHPVEITHWLKYHTLSTVDFSELDNQDVNTIPLRLILSEISNSNSYISEIQVDWQSICSYLKVKNNQIVFDFCKYYFKNAADTFIDTHPICDIVVDEAKVQYIKQLITINENYWDAFVNSLLVSIKSNVDLLSKLPLSFVSKKLDEQELVVVVKYMIKSGVYDLQLSDVYEKLTEQHLFEIIESKFQKDCSDYLSSLTQSQVYDAEITFIANIADDFKIINDHNLGANDRIISEVLEHFSERESSIIKLSLYKNNYLKDIDDDFIIMHIAEFSHDDIKNIIALENISDEKKIKIVFFHIKHLYENNEPSKINDFKELFFNDDVTNKILTEIPSEDSVLLRIILYKNDCISNLDVNFIIYYQDRFTIDEIHNYILSEKLNNEHKYRIAVSYMKYLYGKNDIQSMSIIQKCVRECIKEWYPNFENDWTVNLSEEEKYRLWTDEREVIEKDYSYYLFDNLLNDDLSDYEALYKIKRLAKERIIEGLLNNLSKINIIDNLPTFNKVYFHIHNLMKVDEKSIDAVIDLQNPVFNVIIWHFDKTESFDFETLKTKFIYFNPSDQVRIVKKLFMLAATKKNALTVEMLDSLVRVDRSLFEIIAKEKPELPIDISVDVVIKSLCKYAKEHKFFYEKEIYDIILLNSSVNMGKYKNYDFKLNYLFDKCKGRTYYEKHIWTCNISYKTGIVEVFDNQFEITLHTGFTDYNHGYNRRGVEYWEREYTKNSYFDIIRDKIKSLPNRRWDSNKSKWIVPIDDNSVKEIKLMAKTYNLDIKGVNKPLIEELLNNPTEYVYEKKTVDQRPGITFCEGRSAENRWIKGNGEPFYWCGNAMCFEHQVIEHNVEEWEKYTMFDFCRILGFDMNQKDSRGRFVQNGVYLTFISIVNRMNYMLNHLKCKACGELLMPNDISNYSTHMITRFKCTTTNCSEFGNVYYISKCFNWKCYEIIDQREIKRCPNDWFICKNCGSCCSNRIVNKRIADNNEIGIPTSPILIDFVQRQLGHLERRQFYCYKCGCLTEHDYDRNGDVYKCRKCQVEYERWKYDFNITVQDVCE